MIEMIKNLNDNKKIAYATETKCRLIGVIIGS